MSDDLLKLIPVSEQFVPDDAAQHKACRLLKSLIPEAEKVYVEATPDVRFIDPGSNLEEIHCPICGTEVDKSWWKQAMNTAYQAKFTSLDVNMPCCGARSSLNHLIYRWPAGFARFVLIARNPNTDIDADKVNSIAKVLKCDLKKIWAHY
jgi:hypothetical protein